MGLFLRFSSIPTPGRASRRRSSACLISVGILFAKSPQRDVMQTPADLCSDAASSNSALPTTGAPRPGPPRTIAFILDALRWPSADAEGGAARRDAGAAADRRRRFDDRHR